MLEKWQGTWLRIGFLPALLCAGLAAAAAESSLIFVQVPLERTAPGIPRVEKQYTPQPIEGSRIVRLDPSAPGKSVVNLTPEFIGAQDPDIYFDGTRVLFAGKRRQEDSWDIWEMRADGTDKQCLVRRPNDDFQPVYTGCLNTLNDPQWEQFLFTGVVGGVLTEDGREKATALYTCKMDGTFVRRRTYNMSSDFDPFVLRDGRVLFTSWQRNAGRHPPNGRFPLFVVNTDGIDLMAFYGNHDGPKINRMARETDDGNVLFVQPAGPGYLAGGLLARVSMRRNLHTYEPLSPIEVGTFHSPCPIPNGELLVSHRTNERTNSYAIHKFDTPRKELGSTVYDDPAWHDIDAHILATREKPRGRSTVVNDSKATGWLYCMNAYDSDRPDLKGISPGSVKRVRFVEGVPVQSRAQATDQSVGFAPSRILGDVPVEKDGSFHVEVPAKIPLSLQLLDDNGLAIGTHRAWSWVMPMERRGCIGCHEDRERTPGNVFVDAIQRPGWKLTLPPERRRTVGFEDRVWPIFRDSCLLSGCHAEGGDGVYAGGTAREVYNGFLHPTSIERGAAVTPGDARASGLVWLLFGEILAGPNAGQRIPSMPPKNGTATGKPFGPLERQTFVEWIDLGAPWKSPVVSDDSGQEKESDR